MFRGTGGGTDTARAKALAQARKLGASEQHVRELAKAFTTADSKDGPILWEENFPAINAFILAQGQWRVAGGFGGIAYVGLDYLAARAIWRDHAIKPTPDLWSRVRIIEAEARGILNDPKGGVT